MKKSSKSGRFLTGKILPALTDQRCVGRRMPNDSSIAKAREQGKASGRWRRWLFAALLVGALVVAVLHWGDVKKFAGLVAKARPEWLAAALVVQVATYVLLSLQW